MSLINVDYPNTLGQQQGGPSVTPASKSDAYSLDIFDLIKRKFWLIVFFVLLGIAATMLYFLKAPKTFESTARIYVDEKSASVINSGDGDSFVNDDASIEKYLVTIKSTQIIKPAIEAGKFHQLDTFADCDDILRTLRESKSLAVKPADTKGSSGVMKLAFRGPDPDECQKVLEELVESFDTHIRSTTKNIGGETAQLVTEVHDSIAKQLKDVEEEITRIKGLPDILIVDGRVVDPHQMQMTLMHQDLHDLRRERIKIEARTENIRADRAAGKNMDDLVSEILREQDPSSGGGAYATTHTQLVQLRIQEQDLLNQFGPDHPDVKKIRNQIQMVEAMKVREATPMGSGSPNEFGQIDLVGDFLNQMRQRVELIASEERSLLKSIKEQQANTSQVAAVVENLSGLERQRERHEMAYNTIMERLSEINAYKEHLWRNLQVIDPPSIGRQVAPSLPISLAAGLFLGSLMGLLFAIVKDMAEKTFRSSDDVAEMLNTRVIGHVAKFQKSRNKRNKQYPNILPEVVAIHTPASQASESYRAMRTAIFFKTQESGAKVIQITSPAPGDGKSTTVSNLASSIAQSGRRVLLIDADMRKPVQHKLFGATNEYGLSSVVSGEMNPLDAVQVIQPEYFSIVTSGPIPSNPAELLTSTRFAAILEVYRNEFDFVLIDTPPVLAVTDPSIICGHADLLYMVMRIRNGVRTSALRAKEMIDSMGVEVGGIIINGLRRKDQKTYEYSGQYGYGGYKYGSGPSSATPRRTVPPNPPKGRLKSRSNAGNETVV